MVSKSERRRRLERERWERRQQRQRAAAERARRRRRLAGITTAGVVALAVVATGVVWLYDGPGDTTSAAQSATDTPEAGGCTYTEVGPSSGVEVGLPPADPGDMSGTWTAALQLGGQAVEVELLAEQAPCTVNSLLHLATNDYFDATECHRLTTSDTLRVLQCGDPTASGTGGPGYQFGTENTEGATYPAGTVAMANAGDPQTNGSQFFLVYDDSVLPPDYTVFGRVTGGLDILKEIAAKGTADGSTDGAPADKVVLDDLTVTQT